MYIYIDKWSCLVPRSNECKCGKASIMLVHKESLLDEESYNVFLDTTMNCKILL